MHRDFSKYISTDEDRLTFRRWVRGLGIFYGLVAFVVGSFVAVRSYQIDTSHHAAAADPAATMIATNNNRAH
jgi:hypothetical protein